MNKRFCLIFILAAALLLIFGLVNTTLAAGPDTKSAKSAISAKHHSSDGEDFLSMMEKEQQEEEKPQQESVFLTAVSFIFKLVLVLGLAYGTILVLKRFSSMKTSIGPNRSQIRVIENSSLGANRGLHLIEVGSKKLLVASTPNQISLVAELDADDVVEDNSNPSAQTFNDKLNAAMGSGAGHTDIMQSAKTVAEMLRESTTYFHGKVREVGKFRKKFRQNDND